MLALDERMLVHFLELCDEMDSSDTGQEFKEEIQERQEEGSKLSAKTFRSRAVPLQVPSDVLETMPEQNMLKLVLSPRRAWDANDGFEWL